MTRGDFGVWQVTLQAKDGQPAIPHNSKVKVIWCIECIPLRLLTGDLDLYDYAIR